MTTLSRPRALSVAELQGALHAAWRGDFTAPTGRQTSPSARQTSRPGRQIPHTPAFLPAARGGRPVTGRTETAGRSPGAGTAAGLTEAAVLVLAAHAGAGASTVAVLLGQTAAQTGRRVRLIDCANPARSGVAAATDAELGDDPSGWRRGRRDRLHVHRPVDPIGAVSDVPVPRFDDGPATGAELNIIDAGWPAWDVLAGSGWITALVDTAQVVLVCRATVPAVRQAEQLLTCLPGPDLLITALGPTKWPGIVTASCGPRLRAARERGQVVAIPLDRHLDVTGLSAAALPKRLTAAARALVARVVPDIGQDTANTNRPQSQGTTS